MAHNAVRGGRFLRVPAGAVAIVLIASCGAGTPAPSTTGEGSSTESRTATMPASTTAANNYESARYCQELDNGRWVTNDSAYSTTPCVPDPSDATGDEQADRDHAIPRCFTCKLSDWKRAEAQKARQEGSTPDDTTTTDTGDSATWSPELRARVMSACTSSWGGKPDVCACVVSQVALQVPAYEAASVSSDDPSVQRAAGACDPDEEQP